MRLNAIVAGISTGFIYSFLSRSLTQGIYRKPVPPCLHHRDREFTPLPSVALENDDYHEKQLEKKIDGASQFRRVVRYLEVGAALISDATFITTVGFFQGKLTMAWRISMSINAVVATFFTIFNASLAVSITEGISQLKWLWLFWGCRSLADVDRYDQASRGPSGSIRLIASVPG